MQLNETVKQKLKEVLQLMNDGLTRDEFLAAFKGVMDIVLKIEQNLISKIDSKTDGTLEKLKELQALYKEAIAKIDQENKSSFANWKKWALEQVNAIFIKSELKEKLGMLDEKIKEADDKLSRDIVGEVLTQIKLPEQKEIILDGPGEIADKLESIKKENEKLKISAISRLQEILDELKNRSVRVGGGGTSDMGVAMSLTRIIRKETPTGTINGTNKVFTTSTTISVILSFSINGQAINDDEYSYSKSTITFNTAIPADLAGTSFRITYV